jgi:hypothetical protein
MHERGIRIHGYLGFYVIMAGIAKAMALRICKFKGFQSGQKIMHGVL